MYTASVRDSQAVLTLIYSTHKKTEINNGASCTRKRLAMQEDQIQERVCNGARLSLRYALSICLLS